ncbi:MAG TPA: ferrous iron transporter B, partial [Phycisphaerae bacterium]|nr:ferrous iron transporter B [Phycisphaerae bacterium]
MYDTTNDRTSYTIALAGNPNAGKTSVFNALTGMKQSVGNWPGVTVERLEGKYFYDGKKVTVVDLPGIYSLNAYSVDEAVSRKYILTEKPSVVVNVIDATNLERNLYLTSQLLEMRVPMVAVLNMTDIASQRRIRIDVEHLRSHLDCPVVPMVASRKQGVDELKSAIAEVAASGHVPSTFPIYDEEVEEAIDAVMSYCQALSLDKAVSPRWLAVKMFERDRWAMLFASGELADKLDKHISHIERHTGEKIDLVIADGRYGFVHGLVSDVLRRRRRLRRTVSDAIDRVVLNRAVGIPLFLLIMYCMFFLTINLGDPFINFFDRFCGTLFVDGPNYLLAKAAAPRWLGILLADGVGGGIQTISTLIPPI